MNQIAIVGEKLSKQEFEDQAIDHAKLKVTKKPSRPARRLPIMTGIRRRDCQIAQPMFDVFIVRTTQELARFLGNQVVWGGKQVRRID